MHQPATVSLTSCESWASDTALGRALEEEGVFNAGSILSADRVEGGDDLFQGSEPLLVLWLLLQRRRATAEPSDPVRPYFDSLEGMAEDGAESYSDIASRCAFCWAEGEQRHSYAHAPGAPLSLPKPAPPATLTTTKMKMRSRRCWSRHRSPSARGGRNARWSSTERLCCR